MAAGCAARSAVWGAGPEVIRSSMSRKIIDFQDPQPSPALRHLLACEQAQLDAAVSDIFGFHALQLGLPEVSGLTANRMPHRWLACEAPADGAELLTHYSALPFPADSLDLVVLPHTLEASSDPHATLREVHRVLVPEGRVVVAGLNPVSLWGWRSRPALWRRWRKWETSGGSGEWIGYWRLRDWLRLLGFEVEIAQFRCYRPALGSETWFERLGWMESLGQRWWPIFGGMYFVVAVKRVHGMRLLSPAWKQGSKRQVAPIPVARNTAVAPDKPLTLHEISRSGE